jgi:UDP-N-acetylglucosamine--N-acetylmuramyl-(pentapeptide) pyrophosphoryl-undecaprenol N-acetylglucosamine transferase
MTAPRTIMIMAGGTGGHIFPGLSVAEYLKGLGWRIVWLGSRAGLEAKLVAPRGYEMAWVSMSGVRGKGLLRYFTLPFELLVAFWQSAREIFRHRPDVVLGMGGYVAFPGGMMAALFRRPLAIHEQNAVAGLVNRVLAKLAARVLTGFPGTFPGATAVLWTGNPVRADIAGVSEPGTRYGARSGPLNLLVIGGSLGAQVLNETVPRALALLGGAQRPRVTHQAGGRQLDAARAAYAAAGVAADVVPFIDDMARAYAQADVIVCRAGASTIAEVAAAGIASVLVPFPHAVDDHQTRNAAFLAERAAAVLIPQTELTPERLADVLGGFTREALAGMAQRARAAAKPEATRAVAEACIGLAAA